MPGRCLTLEPLLQSWQHFVLILFVSYVTSSIWVSILATWLADPAFLFLPGASRVRQFVLIDAIVAWMAFLVTFMLCLIFYLFGRAFLPQFLLFVGAFVGFFSHLTLMGVTVRELLPEKRQPFVIAFLDAIGRDLPKEIVSWKAAAKCSDVVGCSQTALDFLNWRTVIPFWVNAALLGVIVTTLTAIGCVVLLMSCICPAEDDRYVGLDIAQSLNDGIEP
jgi:hypothetical protein